MEFTRIFICEDLPVAAMNPDMYGFPPGTVEFKKCTPIGPNTWEMLFVFTPPTEDQPLIVEEPA